LRRQWENLLNKSNKLLLLIILFISTLYGLIIKLIVAKSIWLTSDSVVLGRLSLEFWVNKNFLLSGWHFASTAPNIFAEWIPFVLIPQILSDFDPSNLRVISFVIYIMTIAAFSLLIYILNHNLTNCLFFSAIMANLNPESSIAFLSPSVHVGALFFVGIFLIISLKFFNNEQIDFLKYTSVFLILINLMVFSDSIILAWFVIPTALYYFIFFKNKNLKLSLLFILMCISCIAIYIIKTHFISDFINYDPNIIISYNNIIKNISLYISGLSAHIYGDGELSILKCMVIISYLILIYYTIRNFLTDKNAKTVYIYTISVLSAFILLIAYICTSYATALSSPIRYLFFTAISINLLISLCNLKNRLVTSCFIIILLFGMMSNYNYISNGELDVNPNQIEFDLLNYLNSHDLKYGYGDYWDASILTYFSKGNIIIKPVYIPESQLVPFRLHSSEGLFDQKYETNRKFFLLSRADNTILKKHDVDAFVESFKPEKILYFKDFNIYVYSNDILYSIIFPYNFLTNDGVGTKVYDKTIEKRVFYSDKLLNKSGFLVYGPYIILPKGIYDIQYNLKTDNISNASQKIATLDVFSTYTGGGATSGNIVDSRKDLFATDLTSGKYHSFNLTLNVTQDDKTRLIEFRVFQYLVSNLYVEKINVYKLNTSQNYIKPVWQLVCEGNSYGIR
jgi:hypothetical protein